jgi:hypothetical protein
MGMIDIILSTTFPPSLRSLGKVRIDEPGEFDEQGAVGKAQPKKYRDGIERTFAEMDEY